MVFFPIIYRSSASSHHHGSSHVHQHNTIIEDNFFPSMPNEIKTPDICKYAVEHKSQNIQHVPERMRTHEICFIAVCDDAENMKYVPEAILTDSFYMAVLEKNPNILEYFPKHLITAEVCERALKHKGSSAFLLRYIPEQFKTLELYAQVLSDDYFPPDEITFEICKYAIDNGICLKKHCEYIKDEDCLAYILSHDYTYITYITSNHKSKKEFWDKVSTTVPSTQSEEFWINIIRNTVVQSCIIWGCEFSVSSYLKFLPEKFANSKEFWEKASHRFYYFNDFDAFWKRAIKYDIKYLKLRPFKLQLLFVRYKLYEKIFGIDAAFKKGFSLVPKE